MNEASLFVPLPGGSVRCTACRRYCTLKTGQTGFCGVRKNIDGKLYLLVYGKPLAIQVDPIEKKPVLHMYPGYRIYSIGTAGCDFACQFCQNYDISQRRQDVGIPMTSKDIVSDAVARECDGIAFTYNEPTIFSEFAGEIGMLAREKGMINIFVSNGYETSESIRYISNFLDCITVDFKGNASVEFYRRYISVPDSDVIFDSLEEMKKAKMHVEVTDLVIPEIGDDQNEARRMVKKVRDIFGDDMPISFLRFHPDYRLINLPPTPYEILISHYRIAREEEMKYVYIGNVPGSKYQNTYCPECGSLCVERDMLRTVSLKITGDGKCLSCGFQLNIILGERGKCSRSVSAK